MLRLSTHWPHPSRVPPGTGFVLGNTKDEEGDLVRPAFDHSSKSNPHDIPLSYLVDWSQTNVKIPLKDETLIGRLTGYSGRGISKRHCLIKFHERKTYIVDLNSTNGTYVNGERLKPKQWKRLVDGDTLTLGEFDYHFETELTKSVTRSLTKTVTKTAGATSRTVMTATHPVTDRTDEMSARAGGRFVDADYGLRALAAMVDSLVLGLSWMVLGKFWVPIFLAAFVLIPTLVYGQSFGKKILGLRVINSDHGSALRPGRLLARELGFKFTLPMAVMLGLYALATISSSSAVILLIGLVAFFGLKTKTDQGLFWDQLCKSRVITE